MAYIGDSMNAELVSKRDTDHTGDKGGDRGGFAGADRATYIMCELWCRLGYTLSLSKSTLIPS